MLLPKVDFLFRLEDPIAVFLMIAALVGGVGVYPFLKTQRLVVTSWKVVALVIVAGYCVYQRSAAPMLLFLWPLSLIWFPEYWGNFTGSLRGPSIDQKSPPSVVAACGWFFLLAYPILLLWIANRPR